MRLIAFLDAQGRISCDPRAIVAVRVVTELGFEMVLPWS